MSNAVDVETVSFADPVKARKFIAAMQRLADARRPGAPVRVYISAPPAIAGDPTKWGHRLASVREQLPDGIELLAYADAVAHGLEFPRDWPDFSRDLAGLILFAPRRDSRHTHVYNVGAQARQELRSLVADRPTLIHANERGMIPIIDCYARRYRPKGDRLRITVPKRWDRKAPTLQAALAALQPVVMRPSQFEAEGAYLGDPFMAREA